MYYNFFDIFNSGRGMALFIAGFILFFIVFGGLIAFLILASKWKIYKKAGLEGWEALVPFYSSWKLVEITGLKWWFFFIINATVFGSILSFGLLAPIAGILSLAGLFFAHYNLAIKLNKEPIGYGIGLTLLPIIFYPILAFSKNTIFNNEAEVSGYGPITEEFIDAKTHETTNKSDTKSTSNKKSKTKFCKNCGNQVDSAKFCEKCGKEIL